MQLVCSFALLETAQCDLVPFPADRATHPGGADKQSLGHAQTNHSVMVAGGPKAPAG